jgi:hypothetical protein
MTSFTLDEIDDDALSPSIGDQTISTAIAQVLPPVLADIVTQYVYCDDIKYHIVRVFWEHLKSVRELLIKHLNDE